MSESSQHQEMFEGSGKIRLFVRSWRPSGKVRGLVVIVHGFKAHSGLYQWVAEELVRRDLSVYAMDLRGHGKSEGDRFWVETFDDYVADLERFVALAREREPGAPLFVFGHSAGGVVASLFTVDHQQEMAGLISESFAFELPPPEFVLPLLKGLSHVAPHAHVLNLKDAEFSRDPAVVEAMKNDPLIVHEPGPTETLAAMVRADEKLRSNFGKITLPLLIIHGTADKLAKPHGSQQFFDAAASSDKTLKLYDGYFHDPLHDIGKEQVMADLAEWITTRIPQ